MSESSLRRRPGRDAWLIAWLLTLMLHGVVALGLRGFSPLAPIAVPSHEPEPIQLVFSPPNAVAGQPQEPQFYSELPANRADKAPQKADFLSNVTSRARDRVPGGDAALPRLQGEGDAPMVKLAPDRPPTGTAATASPTAPQPAGPATAGAGDSWQRSVLLARKPSAEAGVRGAPGVAGSSDLPQLEMDNPGGNAALTGDVSLNTTAWNYAPWLDRFRSALMERWMAPPAYSLGILKDGGWAVIEVEISRSGKMTRLDLLEQQGHPSLITSAVSALRSLAPIEPLPADFPEPTLILRIRMIYPKIHPR